MAIIVPTGLPAWTRTAGIEVYGGYATKTNYQSQGVVNPRTDVGAEGFSRMVGDMAAVARTAAFAVITYLNNDTSPGDPTIESVLMMTGVRLTSSYVGTVAPTGFPSATRNGPGDVTFTLASSYDDEYSVSAVFTVARARASAHGSSYFSPQWEIVSATQVRVRCLTTVGSPSTDRRVTLTLW